MKLLLNARFRAYYHTIASEEAISPHQIDEACLSGVGPLRAYNFGSLPQVPLNLIMVEFCFCRLMNLSVLNTPISCFVLDMRKLALEFA